MHADIFRTSRVQKAKVDTTLEVVEGDVLKKLCCFCLLLLLSYYIANFAGTKDRMKCFHLLLIL